MTAKVFDIEQNTIYTTAEIMCVKCCKRWIAVFPIDTLLKDLYCEDCGQGFCIDTGQILEDRP